MVDQTDTIPDLTTDLMTDRMALDYDCVQILYRSIGAGVYGDEELDALRIILEGIEDRTLDDVEVELLSSRTRVRFGALVIGRYSTLPFYAELEADVGIGARGGTLVNSTRVHEFIADLGQWATQGRLLDGLTPRTVSIGEFLQSQGGPYPLEAPFFLKGATTSRKHLFRTHAYAENEREARNVYHRLLDDSLIGSSTIYVREFERFQSFGEGINGLPITNEWRIFVLNGECFASGFYWAEHEEELHVHVKDVASLKQEATTWVKANVVPLLRLQRLPFVCVDVAKHVDGRWRVVELNDGQQSGLSCIPPKEFYASLIATAIAHSRGKAKDFRNGC